MALIVITFKNTIPFDKPPAGDILNADFYDGY